MAAGRSKLPIQPVEFGTSTLAVCACRRGTILQRVDRGSRSLDGGRRGMTRIQSSTGLITGIPIEETVNKLMEIAKQPRNTLEDRTKLLQSEQLAVNQLSSLVLAFQFESNRFAS